MYWDSQVQAATDTEDDKVVEVQMYAALQFPKGTEEASTKFYDVASHSTHYLILKDVAVQAGRCFERSGMILEHRVETEKSLTAEYLDGKRHVELIADRKMCPSTQSDEIVQDGQCLAVRTSGLR